MIKYSTENQECNVLYLHTKGVKPENYCQQIDDWINLMYYFTINQSTACIEKLNSGYQVVGCNYLHLPPHFSGNFWWAKSSYLKDLPSLEENPSTYHIHNRGEFLLFYNNPSFFVMHNSGIDHYKENYPKEKYEIL